MQLTRLVVAFSVLAPSFALAQGWVDRTGLNNPPPRHSHGMAYDPIRGYTVMAGGHGSTGPLQDTWTWDGSSWTQHNASIPNTNTSPMFNTSLAFDPISGMVTAISQTGSGSSNWSVHAWNGTNWMSHNYNIIGGQFSTIGYDPHRQELIAYICNHSSGQSAIHVWDGSTWSPRACPSVPSWSTSSQYPFPCLTWDPNTNRLVLTAGDDFGGNTGARMYEWTGFNWLQRYPLARPLVSGATTTDLRAGCGVMFDGNTYGQGSQNPGHTWTFRSGTYQRIHTPIEPMLRAGTAMAYDSARGATVLFGGTGYSTPPFSDTWELTLGAPASYTSFGGGCPGSRGVPQLTAQGTSLPRIGTTFTAQATNLPWTGLAFLFLGLSNTSYSGTPLPANLGFLGAPACNLLCSGDEVYILPNALGSTSWSFTVPPYPGLSFYNQVLPLDPTANSLGLTLSNAARGVIGL